MALASGYSRETIANNIRKLLREGMTQDRAVAAAYNNARGHFRKLNPGARMPEYLKRPELRRNPVMNPRSTSASASGDDVTAHELFLFAVNESELYRQHIVPVINNLRRKIKRKIYKPDLALKLWRYVADDAAKRYTHGGYGRGAGYGIFTVPIREKTAVELAGYYNENLSDPEWKENPDVHIDIGSHNIKGKMLRLVPNPREVKYYLSAPREYTSGFGIDAVTPIPWLIHRSAVVRDYVRYYILPSDLVKTGNFQRWINGRMRVEFSGSMIELKRFLKAML